MRALKSKCTVFRLAPHDPWVDEQGNKEGKPERHFCTRRDPARDTPGFYRTISRPGEHRVSVGGVLVECDA